MGMLMVKKTSKTEDANVDQTMTERIIFPASKAMSDAISDYRFDKRIDSKADAIRKLIVAGLKAEGVKFKE
jgi:hypothetical protein